MGFAWIQVVAYLTMIGGGVSDYLDLIPSQQYWQQKHVEVSDKAIANELAAPPPAGDISKLIDSLTDEVPANREAAAAKIRAMGQGAIPQLKEATQSGNPEIAARAKRLIRELLSSQPTQQVRQLMAIRTAGEQKMKSLLPRLHELEQSKQTFVADYAAAAIAAIEGKPYDRPHSNSAADLWMFPEPVRGVLHLDVRGGAAVGQDQMRRLHAMMVESEQAEGDKQVDEVLNAMIELADKIGNIRIDGVTMAMSGDVGHDSGFAVILVHGQFNAEALVNLISETSGKKPIAIDGVPVVELDHDSMLVFPSNNLAAMIAGPTREKIPVAEVIAGLKAGKGGLSESAEMKQLMTKVDITSPFWGAVLVTDAMRQEDFFKPIESITLNSTMKDGRLDFNFAAAGRNGNLGASVGQVNQFLGMMKNVVKMGQDSTKGPETRKMIDIAVKAVDSMKCQVDPADANRATLMGSVEAPPATLLMGLMSTMAFSRVQAVPPPQAVPAPPAPNPPPVVPPQAPELR